MPHDETVADRPDQAAAATTKDRHRRKSISTWPTQTEFFPTAPRAEDVHLVDIATALSMKVRYTGHVAQMYTVAQHSVFVADILERMGADCHLQLLGLMHDATEAYLPDVSSTLKSEIFVRVGADILPFREAEDVVWRAVADRFDFPSELPEIVHVADAEAYRHERKAVAPWPPWCERVECALVHPELEEWLPDVALNAFFYNYYRLLAECKEYR